MCGPLDDRPSSTKVAPMCGCSRRRSSRSRFAAFLLDPSSFRVGSGASGSTSPMSGWTTDAPRASGGTGRRRQRVWPADRGTRQGLGESGGKLTHPGPGAGYRPGHGGVPGRLDGRAGRHRQPPGRGAGRRGPLRPRQRDAPGPAPRHRRTAAARGRASHGGDGGLHVRPGDEGAVRPAPGKGKAPGVAVVAVMGGPGVTANVLPRDRRMWEDRSAPAAG